MRRLNRLQTASIEIFDVKGLLDSTMRVDLVSVKRHERACTFRVDVVGAKDEVRIRSARRSGDLTANDDRAACDIDVLEREVQFTKSIETTDRCSEAFERGGIDASGLR